MSVDVEPEDEGVSEVGEKLNDVPDDESDAERETWELKPFCAVRVTVYVA